MTDPKTFRESIKLYADIMLRAWHTAWRHKELWFLAALAGLANTGTVFENVFQTFWRVSPQKLISWASISEFFNQYPWAQDYLKTLIAAGPLRLWLTAIVLIILMIVIAVGVLGSQQLALMSAIRGAKNKPHLGFKDLAKYLHHLHLVRLLAINLIVAIITAILFGLTAVLLSLLLTATLEINFFVYVAVYALILPFALMVNLLGMLCLVNVIRRDEGIIIAWHHSVRAVRDHWIFFSELSLILFVINFLASTLLAIIFFGITICLSVLAALALKAGLLLMAGIIAVFTSSMGVLLIICYGGISTLFNYSVWVEASEKTDKLRLIPAIEHATRAFLKPFRK